MEIQLKKGNGKNNQNKVALEAIAKKLRAGANLVDIDKALDDLLGTKLPERDLGIEGDWEMMVKNGAIDEECDGSPEAWKYYHKTIPVKASEIEEPSVFASKLTKAFKAGVKRAKAGKELLKDGDIKDVRFYHNSSIRGM